MKNIVGINLQKYCRFGNNVQQFANALGTAQKYGVKWINIHGVKHFFLVNPNFVETTIGDVKIYHSSKHITKNVMTSKFFYPKDYPDLSGVDFGKILYETGQKVLELKNVCTSEDIHVHIRSGDIFVRGRPKQNYVQPPLSFYQKAILDQIALKPSAKIIMVYEDKNNPVVDALWAWLKKENFKRKKQSSTISDDVRELATAKVIIGGKGSFIPMIACMTKAHVIFFRDISISENQYKQCGISPEVYFDKGDYIPEHKWQISGAGGKAHDQQMKQLVYYPIENIERRACKK